MTTGTPTLGGTGGLTVSGTTSWGGGTVGGKFVNAGAMTTTGGLNLSGGTLTNLGTLTVGNANVSFAGTSTLTNEAGATLDITSDADLTTTSVTTTKLVNRGTFVKTAGTGLSFVGTPFENSGLVEVRAGELRANGAVTARAGGTYTVGAGAKLVQNNNWAWEDGGAVAGAVAFQVAGGNLTVAAGKALALDLAGEFSWAATTGTLSGGDVTISAATSSTWTGGTISSELANAGAMSINGTSLAGPRLTNTGTLAVIGQTNVEGSTEIVNEAGATIDLQNGGDLLAPTAAGQFITNRGRVVVSSGTASNPSIVAPRIDNHGAIDVQAGVLTVRGSEGGIVSYDGAKHTVAAGAELILLALWDWRASGEATGAGKLLVENGDIAVQSGVTAAYNLTAGGFEFQDGFMVGSGTVQVAAGSKFLWSGGTLQTRLENAGAMTVTGTPGIEGGTLVNTGTVELTGGIQYRTTGAIVNEPDGMMDFRADGDLTALNAGPKTFTNRGRFVKSGGTGETTVAVALTNSGTLEANSGTLGFNQPLVQIDGRTHRGGGTIRFTGGELRLDGGTLTGNGSVLGAVNNVAGTVKPGNSPGSMTFASYTQGVNGQLEIEIGGPTPGTDFDRLTVTGAANLAGTLSVKALDPFDPPLNAVYQVMTHASRTGGFGTVEGQRIDADRADTLTPSNTDLKLTVSSGSDLRVTQVTGPASAEPGQPVTITYTVENLAAATGNGPWVDTAYLSVDNRLDANDILIGSSTHTGAVPEGRSYKGSITANLPAAVPGNYRVIVVTDSQRNNPVLNAFSNIEVSADLTNVDVTPLPLDTPFTGTIKNGQMNGTSVVFPGVRRNSRTGTPEASGIIAL